MDLSKITQVAHTHRPDDVNERLKEGWVLLSSATGKDEEGYPITWYSLGFVGRPAIE